MRRLFACLLMVLVLSVFAGFSTVVAAEEEDPHLKTIDAIGKGYLFMTYAFIGATADGLAEEAFTDEHVRHMMAETIAVLRMIDNYLAVLPKSSLPEENDNVKSLLEICALLTVEAEALAAYAASRKPEDAAGFQLARQKVWPRLELILHREKKMVIPEELLAPKEEPAKEAATENEAKGGDGSLKKRDGKTGRRGRGTKASLVAGGRKAR